jgi:CRISPR-associated protein Cas2
MKVIITYDVNILRVNSVRQLLKQYLSWIQNSVFEGELSMGNLKELQLKLLA